MSVSKPYDIWRDSPLRLAGYCNEVGEAFAPLYPRLLLPTYVVSICYVLGDTAHKSSVSFSTQKTKFQLVDYKTVAIEAGDVLSWQLLASVIFPGLTIKGVAKFCTKLCQYPAAVRRFSPSVLRYTPTAVGLIAIPFIIKPIDMLVDEIMEATYRKHVGNVSVVNEVSDQSRNDRL